MLSLKACSRDRLYFLKLKQFQTPSNCADVGVLHFGNGLVTLYPGFGLVYHSARFALS